jgi:two-component system, OmpR family, copper resistance phosphate regulon response regulator CusR
MQRMKILIVEDEPKVASFVKIGLEENDFEASVAFDGMAGKKMYESGHFDLLILDVNLPVLSGIELCRDIRTRDKNIPVLMLTALGTTEDKITGFESGADDYLLKPFEFRELLARIRALLKRTHSEDAPDNILRVANLEMNLDNYKVVRDGKKIDLTSKEFSLLELFMRNRGRVLSRAEIAEKVWALNFDTGTNVIDVYVNFLRKKVDKDFSPKLIHTQTGIGYMLSEEER